MTKTETVHQSCHKTEKAYGLKGCAMDDKSYPQWLLDEFMKRMVNGAMETKVLRCINKYGLPTAVRSLKILVICSFLSL